MPHRILKETIQAGQQIIHQGVATTAIEQDASSGNHLTYFRHKGIKVKFADIEQVLEASKFIQQAAVLYEEGKEGSRKLIAYVISNGVFNQMDVALYLIDKVPAYMIPALWVCLEDFPRTSDGKIDRNALHEYSIEDPAKNKYTPPRNETEALLVSIIQDLLQVDSISVEDNFFRLGGNSLKALNVISAIRKQLNLNLDIKYFFIYPTIASLAGYLKNLAGEEGFTQVQQDNEETHASKSYQLTSQPKGSIVPIKSGGNKMPLYIVCGGGGTAFTFERFAYMLEDDQPVYGFQQPSDIKELTTFPNTIEDIAAKYVDEILMVDPNGPYALSGHYIGGITALEMARKLEAMGKAISMLAMFDVILSVKEPGPAAAIMPLCQIPTLLRKAVSKAYQKVDFETFLLTRHPKDAIRYKINSLKSLVNKVYHFQEKILR